MSKVINHGGKSYIVSKEKEIIFVENREEQPKKVIAEHGAVALMRSTVVIHKSKFTLGGDFLDKDCSIREQVYQQWGMGDYIRGGPGGSIKNFECHASHEGFVEAYDMAKGSLLGDAAGLAE